MSAETYKAVSALKWNLTVSECTCGHDVDEHGDGFGAGPCLIYPCKCVAFESEEVESTP